MNRLREIRLSRGLTQRDLAAMSGIPPSTVARLDRVTTAKLELESARRLSVALGISVFDLLPPNGRPA